MSLDPGIVTALYQALLGRTPDASGLAAWSAAESADEVIAGLASSPEGKARMRMLSASLTDDPDAVRGLVRLQTGRGLSAVGDVTPAAIATDVLSTLPLAAVTEHIPRARVHVVGPYAAELARELLHRGLADAAHACAVLDDEPRETPDILLLTDPVAVGVLEWGAPHVLDDVRERLICPLLVGPDAPAWLADEAVAVRRQLLHRLGYLEVRAMVRRRHGDRTDVLSRSHAMPDAAQSITLQDVPDDPLTRPRSLWCVADRVPTLDRP